MIGATGIRLAAILEHVRTSLWFLPTVLTGGAAAVSFFLVALDRSERLSGVQGLAWIEQGGPEGARAILSTIAGSMITVAGVTISVTMVALTLASNQFGPRLLRNFMAKRSTQLVLASFLATFLYCVLTLRAVVGYEDTSFVPHLSITFGIVLATFSLGVLIYFIHSVSTSMQAESVVTSVWEELEDTLSRVLSEETSVAESNSHDPAEDATDGANDRSRLTDEEATDPLEAPRAGYLQTIDHERLMELAVEHDVLIRLDRRAGDFVVPRTALGRVRTPEGLEEDLERELLRCFSIGKNRTPTQDLEFSVHQLVQVALRALSPGVNDPFTAIACIDRLGAALLAFSRRGLPATLLRDESGRVRILRAVSSFEGLARAAFDPIRQNVGGQLAVSLSLLDALGTVAELVEEPEHRCVLRMQAEQVVEGARRELEAPADRETVERRWQEMRGRFGTR